MGEAGLRKPKGAQGGSVPEQEEQELCPSEVPGQTENSLFLVPSSAQSLIRKSSGQGGERP